VVSPSQLTSSHLPTTCIHEGKGRESTLFFFFFFLNLESACVIATSVLALSYLSFKTQEHSICNSCSTKTNHVQQTGLVVQGKAPGKVGGGFCKRSGPSPPPQGQALVILGMSEPLSGVSKKPPE